MNYKFSITLSIIFVIVNSLFVGIIPVQADSEDIKYDLDNSRIPIRFWRADAEILPVVESFIFPMASVGGNGGFARLGIAWIVWTIQIGDKYIAAWSIFSKGNIVQFSIVDGFYDSITWNSLQGELFLITTAGDKTRFFWFSTTQESIQLDFDFLSKNHQIYLTKDTFEIYFFYQDKLYSKIDLNSKDLKIETADNILLESFLGMGGMFQLSNGSILFQSDTLKRVIPKEFSNQTRLGYILLQPAVFDLETNLYWVIGSSVPPQKLPANTNNFFPIGFRSSLLLTSNNTLFENNITSWVNIDVLPSNWEIQYYSLIDVDLYLGTIHSNGIQLSVSGNDFDNDFIPDMMENYFFTYENNLDSDQDTIPDMIEIAYGLNPISDDRYLDADGDGINNIEELNMGLDPLNFDTDFGGAYDGWEITYGYDPFNKVDDKLDKDEDGLTNDIESLWNSNPFKTDTDSDGIPDAWEIQYGLDPTNPSNAREDYDNDGRSNLDEYLKNTDPLTPDTSTIYEGLYLWILMLFLAFLPVVIYLWKSLFIELNIIK